MSDTKAGTVNTLLATGLAWALLISLPASLAAQPLTGRLSTLLTEQRPGPVFVPDDAAAAVTRDTVAALFAIEMGTIPVAASSGGFIYRLNTQLGVVERASNGFGPFYTEPTQRNAKGQASFGLRFQRSSFKALQGADLTAGTFPTNATRVVGAAEPFSVDKLQLSLESQTVSAVGSYGVSDRLSVGTIVPVVTVRLDGTRVRDVAGSTSLQSAQSGSSTGLGDIALQGRYRLLEGDRTGVSIGGDLRLPTGRAEDLRGTGKTGGRVLGVASFDDDHLAVHLNGGIGVGGLSREYFWSMATTLAATDRVTFVGELLGRQLSSLARLEDVYQPYPGIPSTETMRWVPAERGLHNAFVVVGGKWNIAGSYLLNASMLIQLTDAGLRSRFTPSVSLEYDFQR